MNLSVNARDAMHDGGELSIGTENTFFDSEYAKAHPGVTPGAYVKLSVSDNGTGIEDADLKHIFEPFFTTKKVGKGTGLGLATVYGIVKQSGGHISVVSVIGSGTTFDIVLPRVIESPGVASVPKKEVVPLAVGPETILLVEDEEMVRALLKETLEACRYKVIEASDGVAALAIGESLSEPIHLLITDVVMPRMGGRELAERLGKLMPDMPVLFVSGYTDDTYVRESVLDAGVNFIQKPFTLENISLRVRELLDAQARRNS
jgi:CheY-like chemotaxis protein